MKTITASSIIDWLLRDMSKLDLKKWRNMWKEPLSTSTHNTSSEALTWNSLMLGALGASDKKTSYRKWLLQALFIILFAAKSLRKVRHYCCLSNTSYRLLARLRRGVWDALSALLLQGMSLLSTWKHLAAPISGSWCTQHGVFVSPSPQI